MAAAVAAAVAAESLVSRCRREGPVEPSHNNRVVCCMLDVAHSRCLMIDSIGQFRRNDDDDSLGRRLPRRRRRR